MSPNSEPGLTLEQMDVDGALQETADRAFGRADFLRKVAIGGSGLVGGSLLTGAFAGSARAALPQSDVDILNFALTLEELEATFYVQGVRDAGLSGQLRTLAATVRDHELAHVRALRKVLGSSAIRKPRFSFGSAVQSRAAFHSTAIVLEDTGVRAYGGQAQYITAKPILNAAAQIMAVEARHAAAFRQLRGLKPAPVDFNPIAGKGQILAAVKRTGFIVG